MRNYANISKKLIVQALGPKANYKEEINTDKIDIDKSGCLTCRTYITCKGHHDMTGVCANCPNKVYETKITYVNEKNQYRVGDRYRLKCTALKLLIYLHFMNPDSRGCVQNIDFKQVAKALNVHPKTIMYNLDLLCEYGYLAYCHCSKSRYNVWIEGYESQGEKHGYGYIVVNEEWLNHVLETTDINALRILIRETKKIDDLNTNGKSTFNTLTNSYKEICRYLPKYVKPWKIRKCLESCREALAGVFETQVTNENIRFTLKEACSAKKIRTKQKEEFKESIRNFLSALNENVNLSLSDDVEDPRFTYMQNTAKLVPTFKLSTEETNNMVDLALEYDYDSVEKALIYVHKEFKVEGHAVDKLGALVRHFIKNSRFAYI